MIKGEWMRLFKNKTLIVVLIAIMAIPTIYTTLFLGSMWNPYGEINNLPVAVVNEDEAVTYNDDVLSLGDDFIDNLKENDSLAFNFVDADAAERGLENGTYYMVITIPKDFSMNATTLMDDKPKKMELNYATNPGTNYIASKMSETALNKIKDSIESEVIKVYARTVFDSMTEVSDGMQDAADGAKKLEDGLEDVLDGIGTYTDGVKELADGTSELSANNEALNNGVITLSSGVDSLKEGTGSLLEGLTAMSDGIGSTMPASEDIKALEQGLDTYNNGINQLNTQLSNLSVNDTGAAITESLQSIGQNTQEAAKNVEAIAGAVAVLSKANLNQSQLMALQTIGTAAKSLGDNLSAIGGNTQSVGDGFTTIAGGLNNLGELKNAVGTMATNSEVVFGGSKSAIDGLYNGLSSVKNALDTNVLPGVKNLDEGVSKVQSGIAGEEGLATSIESYTDAVKDINSGVATLNDNSSELIDGITELLSGSKELADNLADGADEINDTKASDATIEMFSSPIEANETQITTVENNGHAMAAYMMSVALWVACIAFSIMYPLTEYNGELKSGIAWWASKATVLLPIAVIQAILMVVLLNHFNNFNPVEMKNTIIVACLASIAFMSIMYFFNVWLGKVGSFIMLIFMVVQLAGSAGTYPIELSEDFVAKIHKYLPFSYTVEAFRSTIAGGESIQHAIIILGVLFILFTILTIFTFHVRTKRIKQGKPLLMNFLEEEGLV